jgi:hypothetical protein
LGKTALAVHWAHQVADRFPDGQLYVDLRGYDPERPMPAGEALELLLGALGVHGSAVPHAHAERVSRYRTRVAGRRLLLLLENAYSVDQLRDLLPGTASCLVLVTSRHSMPAFVARYGAVRVSLDRLPPAEAVSLLRILIGGRVDAEAEQAVALADRCARLPLALRIAAELAAARPGETLAALVDALGDESRRLDLLSAGEDEYTAVRSVFSWSCRHLSRDALRAFQLFGVYPGRHVDGYAMAALMGTDVAPARRLLEELFRAGLVEPLGRDRFGMYDLLRTYAAEAAGCTPALDRRAVLGRLLDHYLSACAAATAIAYAREPVPGLPAASGSTPSFPSASNARAWLDAERPNLSKAAAVAGNGTHVHRLSEQLARYLEVGGWYADALDLGPAGPDRIVSHAVP